MNESGDDLDRTARYLATGDDTELDHDSLPQLARLRTLLADESVWAQPSPELGDTIASSVAPPGFRGLPGPAVGERSNGHDPVGAAHFRPGHGPRRSSRLDRFRGPRWAFAGGLSLAATVAAVLGLVVTLRGSPADGPETEIALAGTDLAPGASVRAELRDTPSGVAISIYPDSLESAPPGFFYEGWLKGPKGSVPIGTFHARGAVDDGKADDDEKIELWSGVSVVDYPKITITLEPEDGNPTSSGRVVLAGEIPRRSR